VGLAGSRVDKVPLNGCDPGETSDGTLRVKGRHIDVATTKNVVMLRGKVDSDAAKQAAEEITKMQMLDGVKTVKNELQVVAPSTRDAMEEKDEAFTARVQKKIVKNSHLRQADIAV
jgi:BON domain